MKKTTKTVLITVFIIAIIATVAFWFVGNSELEKTGGINSELLGFERQNQPDSDNDGLTDWEENLWGTNPDVMDTDKDGTSDGEEISLLRDPRVPGPNDDLRTPEERYVSLVRDAIEEKEAPLSLFGESPTFVPYEANALQISNTENPTILKTYGLEVAEALLLLPKNTVNEAEVMLSVLDSQNTNELVIIQNSINSYTLTVNKLLSATVPISAISTHLNLLNTANGVLFLLENMHRVLTEPVVALQSAELYRKTLNTFALSISEVNKYFEVNNISFSSEEKIQIKIDD